MPKCIKLFKIKVNPFFIFYFSFCKLTPKIPSKVKGSWVENEYFCIQTALSAYFLLPVCCPFQKHMTSNLFKHIPGLLCINEFLPFGLFRVMT